MNTRLYDIIIVLLRLIFRPLFRIKVEGAENIPAEGGFILCANHIAALDPVYVAVSVPKRRVHFMSKAEVFKFKPFAKLFTSIGAFPVDRGHSDLNAVRTALKVVADGHCLGIFPQGTRARHNERLPMLTGVSMIAMRAKAPIIPCYLDGPYRLFRRTLVRFGPPVDLSGFGRKVDSATLEAVTHAIEDSVWRMQPEKQ